MINPVIFFTDLYSGSRKKSFNKKGAEAGPQLTSPPQRRPELDQNPMGGTSKRQPVRLILTPAVYAPNGPG